MITPPSFKEFENIHEGQRMFIFGCGPSLNSIDLRLLENELTMGCNKLYLNYHKMLYAPTYYMVYDSQTAIVHRDEIRKYIKMGANKNMKVYFTNSSMRFTEKYPYGPDVLIHMFRIPEIMSPNNLVSLNQSGISRIMIMISIIMGVKEVFLIGVDLSFNDFDIFTEVEGTNQYMLRKDKADLAHFDKNYLRGERFQKPEGGNNMILAHEHIAKFAKENGVKIYNLSKTGNAKMFPHIKFKNVMKK